MPTPGTTINELMAWGFRAIIGIATLILVPAGGWLIERAIHSIDHVVTIADGHTRQLDRMETSVADHFDFLARAVADHEARIRQIERDRGGR